MHKKIMYTFTVLRNRKRTYWMKEIRETPNLFSRISTLLEQAQNTVVLSVNKTMVLAYFNIGKVIVEQEQGGEKRARYGKGLLKGVSVKLTANFGKGYSVYNLERMRKFYLVYQERDANSASLMRKSDYPFKLSWTHYLKLLKIENNEEREFYEVETKNCNWSVRELERQYNSSLYERLLLSSEKNEVKNLSSKGQVVRRALDTIKDPYVLGFLELESKTSYSENDLETAIISKLELFLKELGKGFLFVARQQRISVEDENFYVDLVFYNRLLQSFVLIDLKIGKLKHQDLGQMQMYVNYYDEYMKTSEENKTIGIVLCKQKNETLVKITLPKNNSQIFASKYETVLPSKEVLKSLIENKQNNT